LGITINRNQRTRKYSFLQIKIMDGTAGWGWFVLRESWWRKRNGQNFIWNFSKKIISKRWCIPINYLYIFYLYI